MKLKFLFDEEEEKLTKLMPREEYRFKKDYKKMAIKMGLNQNPDDPLHYYDYRGLWEETGKLESDEMGHFPSKWKLKGHPDMYVEGVKTKKEEPIGWEQRTRGIRELPEIPKSTKLKFTADIGLGIGAKAKAGVFPAIPEVEPPIGVSQRMRGIGEVPKEYEFTGPTIDYMKANRSAWAIWFKEFQVTPNKLKFLKGENWSLELESISEEAKLSAHKASELGVNINDWIQTGVYATFFATLAASILPALSGLPKNILNNLKYKVEGKVVKGKELFEAIRRVNYPDPRAGFGKPSVFDRKIFDEFIRKGGLRGLGGNLKKGITITEVQPRFAFGAKLYGGLPADKIVKTLVETGKVTSDIARELSLAKPELVSQVIQNLSITSPAIASKLAPELVRLIPEVKEEAPPVRSEIKEVITKVEPKPLVEPTMPKLTEKEVVPATIEEAKEILKVDPKEPSVPKIKLAEEMVKKKISLADIEAVKGEKIDVKEPRDIIVALRDVKAVKKEVVAKEEIPKVEVKKPEIKAKVNPMAFSNDPLAISRELEFYPDDSALIARKAELIFKQNVEGKEIDYPVYIAKQELELAKTNLMEKFGNDYPEAEKIIKRAEILEKQLEKPTEEMAKKIRETKEFGYPPESYHFTGEYSEQFQGYYRATRNKKIVYAPIYENKEGKTIVDMEQTTTIKPTPAIPTEPVKEVKEPAPEPEVKREVEVKPEEIYKEGERIPTKKVKGVIREITGQIPKKIEIAERDILRLVLRGEAKGARRAFSEGKKEGIFGAKEEFTEVVARAKERKYKRDEIGKVKDILKKTDLKKLRPERQQAVKKIIDEIDIRKMMEKTERRLTSRLDFIKDNPENQIPPEKIGELERLNKKPISDFTAEDISLIKDSILHEINLNKLKNKIIFGKEIKEAVGELKKVRENVLKGKDIKKDDLSIIDSGITEHRTSWQKIKSIWGIQSFNPEVICEELDFKDHGEAMKYIFNGIDNGITEKFKIMQEADDWFVEELEGIDISKWGKSFQGNRKNIDFQTIELSANIELKIPKRKIKITKGERTSFLLHEKNNKNLAHLTKGGFRFSDNLSRRYKMTEENIEEIINSATAEEVKVADTLWKFFNEFIKPKLDEVSMELNGWEIAIEDNYYPIRTVSLDRIRDALRARKTFDNKTLEGMGIFKERVNAKNALIIEDAFTVAYKHLEQTSSYIGLAKPLRYAKLILEDTEFNENVRRVYGKEYINNLKKYLQNIEGEVINLDNVDNLAVDLINKLDSAILGAHIFVMFKQPVSYLIANTEIEAKYLKKAIKMKTDFEEIRENSPQLRSRLDGNITRELGELGNVGKVRKFFLHKSPLNSKVLAGIRKFDSFTIGKIWNACKLEIKEKYPELSEEKYMEKVTERAEEVIRRTQPTWHPKDRSEIARSKSIFVRLLTKYTSQRNKNRIVLKRATLKYNRSRHTATDKIGLLKKYAIVLVANALLIEAINELRRKAYGTKSRSIWQYTIAAIGTALSNFYFVGDLFNSLASKIQKGTYAGYDTGNIVTSYMDNAIDGVAELGRTIEQLKNNERYKSGSRKGNLKYKTSAVRALDKNASTLLSLKGLPYDNIKRLLAGMWKMAGEKEEKKKVPLKITVPKGGKLKFTKPKLKIKSTKLEFTF